MSDTKQLTSPAEEALAEWESKTLDPILAKHPERKPAFQTVSLEETERLYSPADVQQIDFDRDISFPGNFPYTRGIHPTGYRGKLWTMRQFAGFSTPEDTNARFKYLLAQGHVGGTMKNTRSHAQHGAKQRRKDHHENGNRHHGLLDHATRHGSDNSTDTAGRKKAWVTTAGLKDIHAREHATVTGHGHATIRHPSRHSTSGRGND